MKLLKAIPVLPAVNIRDTIDFYENKLGFKGYNFGSYAILRSSLAEVHLYMVADKSKLFPASCFIYTEDVEDLYTRMAEKDLLYPKSGLIEIKFGKKEFSIMDNNKNIIRFGELR